MKKKINKYFVLTAVFISFLTSPIINAQPYGTGTYNNDLPYGNETSLSISTSGDINISITPDLNGVTATGVSTVTVASTDVKGYKLYIKSVDDTNMNNLGALLPSSNNVIPASLAMNTWGYNLDSSNNFTGITLSDVLIKSSIAAVPTGEDTVITYGIKLDFAKPAGIYVADVIYTAVPQTN